MPTCVVVGCHSGSGREEKKYQLESFPKSEELRQKWMEKINRKDFIPSHNAKVCLKHFRRKDFVPPEENKDNHGRIRKRKRLKPTAIPSRHLKKDPFDSYDENEDFDEDKPLAESMIIKPDIGQGLL